MKRELRQWVHLCLSKQNGFVHASLSNSSAYMYMHKAMIEGAPYGARMSDFASNTAGVRSTKGYPRAEQSRAESSFYSHIIYTQQPLSRPNVVLQHES